MRYLCLIYGDENATEVKGVNDMDTIHAAHMAFGAEAGGAGVIAGGDALQPTSTATTIRGELVTDGPYAETKEQLGGYYIIEAGNLDDALKWASRIPHPNGAIEVRPIRDMG